MILSDVLGVPVTDASGSRVGYLIDLRFTAASLPGDAVLDGLVISPRTKASFLGFDRSGVSSPAIVSTFLRWRHRGAFYLKWADVERFGADGVQLRSGYSRGDASL